MLRKATSTIFHSLSYLPGCKIIVCQPSALPEGAGVGKLTIHCIHLFIFLIYLFFFEVAIFSHLWGARSTVILNAIL